MPETVSILSIRRIPRPVSPGRWKDQIAISYAAEGLFPRIVYLEPENDSEDERKRVIAEDLKAARNETRPTVELP